MADSEKMMAVKIKFDLRALKAMFPLILKGWQSKAPNVLTEQIVASIKKGISPVEGQGRYLEYSESYKASILGQTVEGDDSLSIISGLYQALGKRTRPVNLTLSGQMLGSIYTRDANTGVTVGFSDEKADFHDRQGAGKSKVIRRMLPTRAGEKFSRPIMQRVMKLLQNEIIKAEVDKANRG